MSLRSLKKIGGGKVWHSWKRKKQSGDCSNQDTEVRKQYKEDVQERSFLSTMKEDRLNPSFPGKLSFTIVFIAELAARAA